MTDRAGSRRALLVVALALAVLAAMADLTRSDSLILRAWHRMRGEPTTKAERLLEEFEKTHAVPGQPKR